MDNKDLPFDENLASEKLVLLTHKILEYQVEITKLVNENKFKEALNTNSELNKALNEAEQLKVNLQQMDITMRDITVLREIEPKRKSIQNLLETEVAITPKFEQFLNNELTDKSPYIARNSNNMWIDDNSKVVPIIDIQKRNIPSNLSDVRRKNDIIRGTFINKDTDLEIIFGKPTIEEIVAKAIQDNKRNINVGARMSALYQMQSLIESSIFFDSNLSEYNKVNSKGKTPNTLFMHQLYGLIKYESNIYLTKLSVEESYITDKQNKFIGTSNRAYNLKDIKIAPIEANRIFSPAVDINTNAKDTPLGAIETITSVELEVGFQSHGILPNGNRAELTNAISVSIAQLYKIVKEYDKNFFESLSSPGRPERLQEIEQQTAFRKAAEKIISANKENISVKKQGSDIMSSNFFKQNSNNEKDNSNVAECLSALLDKINKYEQTSNDNSEKLERLELSLKDIGGIVEAVNEKLNELQFKLDMETQARQEAEQQLEAIEQQQLQTTRQLNAIYASQSTEQVLVEMSEYTKASLSAEKCTVYAVDTYDKSKLIASVKDGNEFRRSQINASNNYLLQKAIQGSQAIICSEKSANDTLIVPLENNDNEIIGVVVAKGKQNDEGKLISFSAEDIKKFDKKTGELSSPIRTTLEKEREFKIARTDPLTHLSNRKAMDEFIKHNVYNTVNSGRDVSAIFFDIDKFKSFNDTYGHDVGDTCLKQVAETISNSYRNDDNTQVFRYGGEEMVVIVPTNEKNAEKIANRIREDIANKPLVLDDGLKLTVNVSGGVKGFEKKEFDKFIDLEKTSDITEEFANFFDDQCIKKADNALYISKESGRNKITSTTSIEASEKFKEFLEERNLSVIANADNAYGNLKNVTYSVIDTLSGTTIQNNIKDNEFEGKNGILSTLEYDITVNLSDEIREQYGIDNSVIAELVECKEELPKELTDFSDISTLTQKLDLVNSFNDFVAAGSFKNVELIQLANNSAEINDKLLEQRQVNRQEGLENNAKKDNATLKKEDDYER